MPDSVVDVKDRVEHYKALIQKREDLNKEFQSWVDLYKEMGTVLAKVKEVYEVERTKEAKEELDKWLKEEKDYLEIINEYAGKFQEINEELGRYDERTLEEQSEYLANVTRFQELSTRMKEIEKRSKKIAGNATIGTNLVELENAEGRKKKINETFALDYMKLAEEKRALAKVIRKQYNALINQPAEVKSEASEVTFINPPKPEVVYDENYYDSLSEEEKIKELEARMERMTRASGRKQRIKYKGEMVELPRAYVGQYLMCGSEISKLRKQIEEREKSTSLASPFVTDASVTPLSSNNNFNIDLPVDDPIVPTVLSEEDLKFERENAELIAMLNKHYEEVKQQEIAKAEEQKQSKKKPKGFMKILKIEKPKFLKNLKEKLKKAACVLAATTILAVSTVPAVMGIINAINKDNSNDLDIFSSTTTSSSEQQEERDDSLTFTPEFKLEIEKEESVLRLGTAITINEGVRIYNNMYDATLCRDGLTPYYGNEVAKTIGGLAINYDGQLYFFYANDSSAQENIDKLLANGGTITAVLGMNEHGYEGFYNINDVRGLNQALGGINR